MNELIKVNYNNERPTVSARELHKFLEIKTHFKDWFPRMCEYGFEEGIDYNPLIFEQVQIEGGRQVARKITDYQLTIPMGKELCMLQRTEKGKQARLYFIRIEEAWNTPEMVMSRALKMAENQIQSLKVTNSRLSVENAIMHPKADYFDELVDRNLLTNFRDTAKALKIKERKFIAFLLDKKFIYRDKKGKLKPYADKNNGLFEIKETMNEKTGWVGTQTLITPKGRETFILLITTMKEESA
ncbi:antA/AntB antirepressor family protein [Tissierella sp. MSJ-40]|uniref:AntA/AntB antirepressor family protein n=1 Tax=Tissierella simiarum TaxID=2841534 RepID=A0ABS6EAV2_9FIRM|nr:antA/AntB antirepressor family protein [Tissierella simiarum]MBU5439894.1 antA/AntB antirepressor family protein [Tissierella simiarum]